MTKTPSESAWPPRGFGLLSDLVDEMLSDPEFAQEVADAREEMRLDRRRIRLIEAQ